MAAVREYALVRNPGVKASLCCALQCRGLGHVRQARGVVGLGVYPFRLQGLPPWMRSLVEASNEFATRSSYWRRLCGDDGWGPHFSYW